MRYSLRLLATFLLFVMFVPYFIFASAATDDTANIASDGAEYLEQLGKKKQRDVILYDNSNLQDGDTASSGVTSNVGASTQGITMTRTVSTASTVLTSEDFLARLAARDSGDIVLGADITLANCKLDFASAGVTQNVDAGAYSITIKNNSNITFENVMLKGTPTNKTLIQLTGNSSLTLKNSKIEATGEGVTAVFLYDHQDDVVFDKYGELVSSSKINLQSSEIKATGNNVIGVSLGYYSQMFMEGQSSSKIVVNGTNAIGVTLNKAYNTNFWGWWIVAEGIDSIGLSCGEGVQISYFNIVSDGIGVRSGKGLGLFYNTIKGVTDSVSAVGIEKDFVNYLNPPVLYFVPRRSEVAYWKDAEYYYDVLSYGISIGQNEDIGDLQLPKVDFRVFDPVEQDYSFYLPTGSVPVEYGIAGIKTNVIEDYKITATPKVPLFASGVDGFGPHQIDLHVYDPNKPYITRIATPYDQPRIDLGAEIPSHSKVIVHVKYEGKDWQTIEQENIEILQNNQSIAFDPINCYFDVNETYMFMIEFEGGAMNGMRSNEVLYHYVYTEGGHGGRDDNDDRGEVPDLPNESVSSPQNESSKDKIRRPSAQALITIAPKVDEPKLKASKPSEPEALAKPKSKLALSPQNINYLLQANPNGLTLIENGIKLVIPTDALEKLALDGELTSKLSMPSSESFEIKLTSGDHELTDLGGLAFDVYIPYLVNVADIDNVYCDSANGKSFKASGYDESKVKFSITETGLFTIHKRENTTVQQVVQTQSTPNVTNPKIETAEPTPTHKTAGVILPIAIGSIVALSGITVLRVKRRGR